MSTAQKAQNIFSSLSSHQQHQVLAYMEWLQNHELIEKTVQSDEFSKVWSKTTALQFFQGYTEADSIYDKI